MDDGMSVVIFIFGASAPRAVVNASAHTSAAAMIVSVCIVVFRTSLMNVRLIVLIVPFPMSLRDLAVYRTLGLCADRVDETDKKNQPGTAIHFSCMQECRLSLPEAVS